MGIVQRQGLRNTLISYAGLAIGFLTTTFVLPQLLSKSQLGLTTLLLNIGTVAAQVAAFGFASTGMRYFPYFRGQGRGHAGFLPLLLGVPMLGLALVAGLLLLGKPWVLHWYADTPADAALLSPHYGAAIGLAACILIYSLQDAYLKGLFHTAFSSFVQEVLLRVFIVAAAGAYGLGWLSFDGFVGGYLGAYAAAAGLLTLYLLRIRELHLRPTRAALRVKPLGELLRFGGFALLSNISGTVLLNIDSILVGAKMSLAAAGVYVIATNISTALTLPFRALTKTAFPLIAEYWKEGRMDRLADFYRRTTRLNTVIGCYLALGIGLNLDFLYGLIHKPGFAAGTTAVLILLAGRLVDGIAGVNGIIVVTSPRYRFDLIFNLTLAAATIALNWVLIPRYGLAGAALSYSLALTTINVVRTLFVWRAYQLQPFDGRILRIVLVAAVAGGAAWLVPSLGNAWLTLLARGGLLTLLYGAGMLLSGAAPELTGLVTQFRQRLVK